MDLEVEVDVDFSLHPGDNGRENAEAVVMIFDNEQLRQLLRRTSCEIELRNEYGRCYRRISSAEALDLDLEKFVGIGNYRRIRFLRPRNAIFALNAGSRTTQRLKGESGRNISHPLVREHRRLQGKFHG